MNPILNAQLDFVLFFYGLAFILLGAVCLSVSRATSRRLYSGWLGSFAVLHGVSEWLDLTALLAVDTPSFARARAVVMTASFLLLMEFARLNARQFGRKLPNGIWYLPLIVLLGLTCLTLPAAGQNAIARYTTGLVGALGAAWVLFRHARDSTGFQRRLLGIAGAEFLCYAIAAGTIVPAAPFWPANVFNYQWFSLVSGVPIQLVRGVLACCMALTIWGIWKRALADEVASARYMVHVQSMFARTLLATVIILAGGWALTEFLGEVRTRNMRGESLNDLNSLSGRFDAKAANLDRMVEALAASPYAQLILRDRGVARGNSLVEAVLPMGVAAAGADEIFIADHSGVVADVEAHKSVVERRTAEFEIAPYLRDPLWGVAAHRVDHDPATGSRSYFSSYPIRADDGSIAGVIVLRNAIDEFVTDINIYGRTYFLVDTEGRIALTNRAGSTPESLWPLPSSSQLTPTHRSAGPAPASLLSEEIEDSTWINLDGELQFARRRAAANGQWSVILVIPTAGLFASRVLGIVITLLVTLMALIYLYLKDRSIRDNIELERRLSLQAVAQNLRRLATTDPLTELSNRLRFDEALREAIERAQRYDTGFSVIIYDVDHFKRINDNHGHQAGDAVLVGLSRMVSDAIRTPDLVARWGGEEFVILAHGADGLVAVQAAERLRMTIEECVFDVIGHITCSFGVAHYATGDTAHSMLARADSALYRAKTGGRNRVESDCGSLRKNYRPTLLSS